MRAAAPSPATAQGNSQGKAAGAGSPSRTAAITSRALLRVGMAQATVPRPGTSGGNVESSALSAGAPSGGSRPDPDRCEPPRRAGRAKPGRGEAARSSPQCKLKSHSLSPSPRRLDRQHPCVRSWGPGDLSSQSQPGSTDARGPCGSRQKSRERGGEQRSRERQGVPMVVSHRQQK